MKKTLMTLLALMTTFSVVLAKDDQAKSTDSIEGHRNKILAKFDANKDGKLDANEIDAMIAEKKEKHQHHRKEALEKYDINKNGKLDEDERAKMKSDRLQEKESKVKK